MSTVGSSSASWPGCALACALYAAWPGTSAGQSPVASTTVKWMVEATLITISDPTHIFSNLRLGDPVRGVLKYDRTLTENPLFSDFENNAIAYTNWAWFEVARMLIDNPRGGSGLHFEKDEDGDFGWVFVGDDYEYDDGEVEDFLYAVQSVHPPAGFDYASPVVSLELDGAPDVLTHSGLPTELRIDDWLQGTIWFSDFDAYYEDDESPFLEAEINGLTLLADGDFDFDADVDGADLALWRASVGSSRNLSADADGDTNVDGRDFLIWQRQLVAAAMGPSVAGVVVPEPTGVGALAAGCLAGGAGAMRRRKHRG